MACINSSCVYMYVKSNLGKYVWIFTSFTSKGRYQSLLVSKTVQYFEKVIKSFFVSLIVLFVCSICMNENDFFC